MQFTDSHHHLQDYKAKNTQQIINDLKNICFAKIVCVSSHPNDWDQVAEIAKKNSDTIIPAFGVHPWYIHEVSQNWDQKLENFLMKFPDAQIGECGLDHLKAPLWEGQIEILEKQINLANRFQRPLNIHLLKAEEDFFPLLPQMPKKFMFHSFGGCLPFLKKALDYGAYISLSAALLKRRNAIEIINILPLDRLLCETDAPYQSSAEEMIDFIGKLSEIRHLSKIKIIEVILQNFKEFNSCQKKG